MDSLRLILLLALLLYGATAIDRARQVICAHRKALPVSVQTITGVDRKYIRHVAGLASVQPARMVVQDSMLPGTELSHVARIFLQPAHETEAIQDAYQEGANWGFTDGILYTSQKPAESRVSGGASCDSIIISQSIN